MGAKDEYGVPDMSLKGFCWVWSVRDGCERPQVDVEGLRWVFKALVGIRGLRWVQMGWEGCRGGPGTDHGGLRVVWNVWDGSRGSGVGEKSLGLLLVD